MSNESQDFQTGKILTELQNLQQGRDEHFKSLSDSIDRVENCFNDFKKGMGQRVEKHGERLAVAETNLVILNRLAWLLFACSLTVVVGTFWQTILKK